jgi:hypothetical protein
MASKGDEDPKAASRNQQAPEQSLPWHKRKANELRQKKLFRTWQLAGLSGDVSAVRGILFAIPACSKSPSNGEHQKKGELSDRV